MSTHNIGFYEDLTKIIFELSSNIFKYAPYFFCCASINLLLELFLFILIHLIKFLLILILRLFSVSFKRNCNVFLSDF